MTEDQPALFDLPGRALSAASGRAAAGRSREAWSWTVTADVTVVDTESLRDAARRAEENAVAMGLSADPTTGDPDVQTPGDAFDILAWLVWPTDGLETLLEVGAFRILEVGTDVAPTSDDTCALSWTVTVKLTDVAALRRVAGMAHPDDRERARSSLAVAWQQAADPFAPLRGVPGITWQPVDVVVQHLRRRQPA